MSDNRGLADKLLALNAAYAAGLQKKLNDIDAAMQAFMCEPGDMSRLELLHTLLHSLAGSAGTFGFDELGRRARRFEYHCDPWLEGKSVDPRQLAQLPGLLATLRACAG